MPISTDDCKTLLVQDTLLRAAGARDAKGWKRLSKKNGVLGIERVFSHPSGVYAKLTESGNTLWIAASATSMAELDDPLNQRVVAPVAQAPTTTTTQWCWPVEAEAAQAKKAQSHVKSLLAAVPDADRWDKLYATASKLDPIALANQYTFAICRDTDSSDKTRLWACITPTAVWLKDHVCYDMTSPIGHLLPAKSGDVNDCGSWVVHGFEKKTPLELATFLLAKGFQWDPVYQTFLDGCGGTRCGRQLAALVQARNAGGPGFTP